MSELRATEETFAEVAELLFGGGGQELLAQISKANPSQSDLATHDRKKRAITAGLSAVGATAGAAGLGYAAHKTGGAYRAARYGPKVLATGRAAGAGGRVKMVRNTSRPLMSRGAALKRAAGEEKFGTALIPLEVAGLAGEASATKILHGDTKQKKKVAKRGQPVSKDIGEMAEQVGHRPTKGALTRAVIANPKVQAKGVEYTRKGAGALRRLPSKVGTKDDAKVTGVTKRAPRGEDVEVVWSGEFAKADADKQQVFGWASVVEMGGEPVLDLQGDVITPDEMEKAAYSYVVKSRKGGDMHLRDNWEPIQKSEMIESFIVTDEKRQAMGLPDSVPTGWWVGFQVQDPQVWTDIKAGKRTGFSIHGTGRRSPV